MSTSYNILQPTETDEVTDLLGQAFAKRDPPAIAAGLTVCEFEQFVRLLCPNAVADGLTIVARDQSTGKLAGVLLAEDCASPDADGLEHVSSKFNPIFEILETLGDEYWSDRENRHGQSVHMFLLGVSESAAGRGVAYELVEASIRNAIAKGYTRAVTEATNMVSQHIFRNYGFKCRGRQSYAAFRHDGNAVFQSIADQGGPMIMDYLMSDESR